MVLPDSLLFYWLRLSSSDGIDDAVQLRWSAWVPEVREERTALLTIPLLSLAVAPVWPSAQGYYPSPACSEIEMLLQPHLLVNEGSSV